jgi:hypothetical protein
MLAAGTLAGTAHAGGKVAVLNVEGDQSGQVEDALTSIVEDEHEVVSSQTFDEVAEKAGVKALDTKGIAKVAKRLAVAAVVEGVMTRDDSGYDLTVRIRAQSGKTTKKVEVAMAGKKLSAKDRRSLGSQVLAALDEIDPRSGKARRDENLDREDKDAKHRARTGKLESADDAAADDAGDAGDDGDAPKAKAKHKKAKAKAKPKADDDDAAAAPSDDGDAADSGELAMRDKPKHKASKAKPKLEVKDDADDASAADAPADPAPMRKEKKAKHKAKGDDETAMLHDDEGAMGASDRASEDEEAAPADGDEEGVTAHAHRHHDQPKIQAAVIDAGVSVTGRQLTFTSRAYSQAPHGYKGPFAPGGHVDGAIYPLAFGDRSGAGAGLGMDFEYDQTTSLTTRTSEAMSVVMPTSEDHWSIGGRYRIAIGSGGTQVAVGLDYSHRQFVVDRSGLPAGATLDMPDVVYKAYAPEVAARIPLGARVTLTATGRVLLIKSAGAIQTQAEYGAAKITGGEGAAGLEILISSNVVLNISGTAAVIGYAFVGNGQQSANRDGDPTTKDVGGAMDQYMGGMATLGIAY